MSSDDPRGSGSYQPSPSASGPVVVDPMVGKVIDRYRITAKLGEGGMGEVYAAEHIHIEMRVAIKVLRAEIVSNQEAVQRFRQEARSASSIGHKNIIQIQDFGEMPDGRIFLCMELLQGKPFNDLIEEGALSPDRLLNVLIQTGHGLAAAHKKNIVHRDMKPENIFVTAGDVPKLLDFGIAKVSGADGNNHLTRTGTIFGTPFYMAPEQALGQNVDARADVYAMGVIMYEVFCGCVPFSGESFMGILTQHITAEPMPPAQRAAQHGKPLPPGIDEVIVKAMKKDPDERHQTMDELVQALVSVYRRVAGAGMSSYMQAHQPPPSIAGPVIAPTIGPSSSIPAQHPYAPTPPPYQGHGQGMGHGPGPGGPSRTGQSMGGVGMPHPSSPTPMPIPPGGQVPMYHPHPTPGSMPPGMTPGSMPGYAPPGSASYPVVGSGEYVAPARSRAWIFILIFLVVAGGGGFAAYYFLVLNQSDDEVAQNDKPEDKNEKPDEKQPEDKGDDKPIDKTDPEDKPDDKNDKPILGAVDAGAKQGDTRPPAIDAGGAVTADKKVQVLLSSDPDRATVFVNGKQLDERTPLLVDVTPGEPVQIELKKNGFKDSKLSVDGKKAKLNVKLKREKKDEPVPEPGSFCDKPENKNKDQCLPKDSCKRAENKGLARCQLE